MIGAVQSTSNTRSCVSVEQYGITSIRLTANRCSFDGLPEDRQPGSWLGINILPTIEIAMITITQSNPGQKADINR